MFGTFQKKSAAMYEIQRSEPHTSPLFQAAFRSPSPCIFVSFSAL